MFLTNFARVLIATQDPRKRAEAVNYLERAKQVAKPGFERPSLMLDELRKEDDEKGNGIFRTCSFLLSVASVYKQSRERAEGPANQQGPRDFPFA